MSIIRLQEVNWEAIEKELHTFNAAYRKLKTWGALSGAQALQTLQGEETLVQKFGVDVPSLITHPTNSVVAQWLKENFAKRQLHDFYDFEWEILGAFEHIDKSVKLGNAKLLPKQISDAIAAYDGFVSLANDLIQQVAPARFQYAGFKIWNPQRLAQHKLDPILKRLSQVIALFRRRNVMGVLGQSVKQVVIRFKPKNSKQSAAYLPASRWLVMNVWSEQEARARAHGRFLESPELESLLHELGHHIYYSLSPNAMVAWDAFWSNVKRAEYEDERRRTLTQADRLKYWLELQKGPDPRTAIKDLEAVEEWRIYGWLRLSGFVEKRGRRLTTQGKELAEFIADPKGYTRAIFRNVTDDEVAPEIIATYENKLRRDFQKSLKLDIAGVIVLPPKLAYELAGRGRTERKNAIDELEVPSDYARTDPLEDFAETFTLFMMGPERLSSVARYRMKRTLVLSGLYGKPVMRVAGR